jgi:hypothetical protein
MNYIRGLRSRDIHAVKTVGGAVTTSVKSSKSSCKNLIISITRNIQTLTSALENVSRGKLYRQVGVVRKRVKHSPPVVAFLVKNLQASEHVFEECPLPFLLIVTRPKSATWWMRLRSAGLKFDDRVGGITKQRIYIAVNKIQSIVRRGRGSEEQMKRNNGGVMKAERILYSLRNGCLPCQPRQCDGMFDFTQSSTPTGIIWEH